MKQSFSFFSFFSVIFFSTILKAQTEKSDASIISENSSITITGEKMGFIEYTVLKKIKIKIYNEAGIKRFSKITLPELFDPTLIYHAPESRNIGNYYANYTINFFNAKIKKSKNKAIPITPIIDKKEARTVLFDNKYKTHFYYDYKFNNIGIGDTLELEYEYSIPFKDTPSRLTSIRIFFHDDIDKEHFSFKLSIPEELVTTLTYFNNANPDSIIEKNKRKYYYWTKNKLPGCISEINSRPYLTLPYFVFSIKPYDFLYTLPYSFERKFIPFYAMAIFDRESSHMYIIKSVMQGLKNSQMSQVDKFITERTSSITVDTLGEQKLIKLHNTIADEFNYTDDANFFKGIDIREERVGDYLTAKTLRDISRYSTYVYLVPKIDLDLYTGYLMDKRAGEISDVFITPMFDCDYMIVPFLKNGNVHFIYPKKHRFGYYINEFPFYFESSKIRLVHFSDYLDIKNPIKEQFRAVTTPVSNLTDNVRKCDVLVKADLENLSAIFDAKIFLAGQFSTLTRGLYKYDFLEPTVNKLYGKKIWEFDKNVSLLKKEFIKEEKDFPFKTTLKAQYTCQGIFKKNGDIYSLSIKDWFFHIINSDLTNKRVLDYYPDFLGTDTYTYFIQFPKNIKLKQDFEKIELKNSFGELIISMDQPQSNTIRITSFFSILSNKVSASNIIDIKNIFDSIQKMNSTLLEFTVSD